MKSTNILFFIGIILTGFIAGIGFVNAIGFLPAAEDTSLAGFVEYWKNLDRYMMVRMPILGWSIIATSTAILVLLFREKPFPKAEFSLIALSLLMLISDIFLVLTKNQPINELLRNLDVNQKAPESFLILKEQALRTFYLRSIDMILCNVFMVLAYFVYTNRIQSSKN
ncbi:hypothetical protein [Leptospira stimsonii]|uniref:DUF1772 domain-containing protein n=1 Tax=Leptospira stimsonii TaxID=2202203 RepID=A0A8B3CUI9_9LEPT|nr:hypothetical protein [Leptospira stimsonii]RHX87926.1 hypothetical protein DLM78_02850 [Leptospira stimsonii]